jgi:Ser/Thr protein kinase RdoA (MazF antagonist)
MNHWSSIVPGWWHQRIEQLDEKLSPLIERERLNTIMDRAFEHLRNRGAAILARLQKMLDGRVDCHWIVRDLWRENILIDHQRISGIVDFGASRIDWPAFDIVRWISSWLAPDDPRISECFRAYPVLAEDDYRFLDYLGTLLSLLQWLEWLLSSQMSFVGQEARVRSRMIELDQRLSRIGERIPSAHGHHAFW